MLEAAVVRARPDHGDTADLWTERQQWSVVLEQHNRLRRDRPGEGDLLGPLLGVGDGRGDVFDVIVSNPPYILHDAMPGLQAEVAREPGLALDGGYDGLDTIRPLLAGIRAALKPGRSAAYIEIDPPIAESAIELAGNEFPDASVSLLTDLAGLTRCLAIELG